MTTPAPIFARDRTAAKLLDMTLGEFRDLVSAGSLPKPVRIGGKHDRWPVDQLQAISSGAAMREAFEW